MVVQMWSFLHDHITQAKGCGALALKQRGPRMESSKGKLGLPARTSDCLRTLLFCAAVITVAIATGAVASPARAISICDYDEYPPYLANDANFYPLSYTYTDASFWYSNTGTYLAVRRQLDGTVTYQQQVTNDTWTFFNSIDVFRRTEIWKWD